MAARPLETVLDREVERWRIPAVAVGLLHADGRVETLGRGGADGRTRFRVASITKPVTATLAALLAAEGALDLVAPVHHGVSISELLAHVSGIPSESGDPEGLGDGDDALPALAARIGPPSLPRVWSYSNAGFWLTAELCARAGGGVWEDVLERRLLRPLGLESTSFAEDGLLPGHDPHAPLPERYPRARRPSGGLVSTAEDMLRFARFHLGDGAAVAGMRRPLADGIGFRWGLGWELSPGGVVAHNGGWGGFRSRLALVPEAGAAAVVLMNSSASTAAVRALTAAALEEVAGVRRPQPRPVELPEAALDALAGTYRGQFGDYAVSRAGGGLAVEAERQPALVGVPVAAREFVVLDGPDAGARFDFPLEGWARIDSRLAERTG